MKKLLAVILLLQTTIVLAQPEKNVESEIKNVKVYLNGAVVTRTAKANLESGKSKLVFGMLSPFINQQSISVSGSGEATIVSVQYELNYLNDQHKTPEVKSLEDSLQSLNDQMQWLQNSKYVLDQEESLLLENKKVNDKDGATATQLNSLADLFISRLTAVKEKQTAKSRQIKKQQEMIDKITRQLAAVKLKFQNGTGNIIVTLSAKARMPVTLEFSYLVNNAQWVPSFDLRCADINSPLQLAYKANVSQSTGEDWSDVKLKLSTGNPTLSGTKPELQPWYLSVLNPQVMYRATTKGSYQNEAPASISSGAVMDMEKKESGKAETFQWTSATVTENQLANDFDIATPYNIPSDGKQYLVEVQNYSLNATYKYSAVPKSDRDAFLIADIKDWEELNLISGDASIYFQNSFVGNSYINTLNTEDTLTFSLGRDKRIVISREKLKDFSQKQFIGSNVTKTYTFEISIKNTKKDSVSINIEDQIPLSTGSDIEVKLTDNGGADLNAESGKLNWVVAIAAGETQKRKFTFTVKYPKGKVISGL